MARTSSSGSDDELVRELVTSPQRPHLLRHLADRDGRATFDDLVGVLADGSGPTRLTPAVALHHIHLPKLASTGALDWEAETGTVRLTPRARRTLARVEETALFGRVASD
jgi:hypothetical protein